MIDESANWETCENCEQKKRDVVLRAVYDVPLCDDCTVELDGETRWAS